jgi:hypothetical protein
MSIYDVVRLACGVVVAYSHGGSSPIGNGTVLLADASKSIPATSVAANVPLPPAAVYS